MAKINLDNIYTSSKYITVMGLLKALIEDVDAVDYTPASDFTTLSTTVTTNTSDIASNKALINKNTSDIATNKTNISVNATSISTLNTKVDSNKESTDKSIAALNRNDTRHDSQITTLNTKVDTNISDINNNKNNIAINTKNIATNKANIATNTTDIATNKTNIATNTTDIATNKTNIATNTTGIATNKADIEKNNGKISHIFSTLKNIKRYYVHNIFIKDSHDTKVSFTLITTDYNPIDSEDGIKEVLHHLTFNNKDNLINCVGITDSTLYYLFAYDGKQICFFTEPGSQSGDVVSSGFTITDTVFSPDNA